MFKLNEKQIGLMAEAVKDIGMAVFGVFSLPSVMKVLSKEAIAMPDVAMFAMGLVLFVVLFGISVALLADENPEEDEEEEINQPADDTQ